MYMSSLDSTCLLTLFEFNNHCPMKFIIEYSSSNHKHCKTVKTTQIRTKNGLFLHIYILSRNSHPCMLRIFMLFFQPFFDCLCSIFHIFKKNFFFCISSLTKLISTNICSCAHTLCNLHILSSKLDYDKFDKSEPLDSNDEFIRSKNAPMMLVIII